MTAGPGSTTRSGSCRRPSPTPSAGDDEPLLFRAGRATAMRHHEWLRWTSAAARSAGRWADFFTRFDVLLCPVFPVAAFPHQVDDDPIGVINRTVTVGDREVRPRRADLLVRGDRGRLPAVGGGARRAHAPTGLPVGVQVVADFRRTAPPSPSPHRDQRGPRRVRGPARLRGMIGA